MNKTGKLAGVAFSGSLLLFAVGGLFVFGLADVFFSWHILPHAVDRWFHGFLLERAPME
jgi:hypothetical protein